MRSYYSNNQIYEQESRNFFNNICTQLKWKFRSYEQDNDIDGEIEIFSVVDVNNNIVYETEGNFIKIQLKASTKLKKINNNYIKYNCPVKLLHFADVCDIPIILVLYDIKEKKGYWIWLQDYIYNELDSYNMMWRVNQSCVSMKILNNNIIRIDKNFESKFRNIARNGIKEILQLRKKDTIEHYYTELSQQDHSYSIYRRIQVNILIEKSFSKSTNAMKILIQKLNNLYRKTDYFKFKDMRKSHDEVDILWLHFYNDVRQKKNGIAFCHTEWVNPKKNININTISVNEKINDIKIHWDNTDVSLQSFYINDRMTKGEYIELIKSVNSRIIKVGEIFNYLFNQFSSGVIKNEGLILEIIKYSDEIEKLNDDFTINQKYPPFECSDVNQKMLELLTSLQNITIILNDNKKDIKNKLWGINFYLKEYNNKLSEFKYEFKKIH